LKSINYALLFLGCVLFHIAGTWSLPLIDRDEPRFAEASREMMERGDYIVPYFNNQLRLDKPPLAYWAQTLSYRVFGENDFAARFPSAVAAALIALSLFAWGSQLNEEKLGWWAAIIFSLSLQTFVHAKAAVADMWLVLFMTTAHWAGYEVLARSSLTAARPAVAPYQQMCWWWIFYVSLALGFLAKGPIAWTPLLTVLGTMIFMRDWQSVRRFKFILGILLTVILIALWAIPALLRTHGEFYTIGIGRHVIGRSLATMEGHGANSLLIYLLLLPFYFATVFVSFFPWSIKLPWLIRTLYEQRNAGVDGAGYNGRLIDNYLITGIATIFILFTLISTKLPHYTLPAFPLLSLLLARHWQAQPFFQTLRSTAPTRRPRFSTIAVTIACVWVAITLIVPPMVARFFAGYELLQQSRGSLRPDMQFASVDFGEPSLVWYFRSRVEGFLTPLNKRRAAEFMAKPGPRFTVLPTPLAGPVFANPPQNWQFFTTSGFNIAKGKRVDLTLVLKPE